MGRGKWLTAPAGVLRIEPTGMIAGILSSVRLGGFDLVRPTIVFNPKTTEWRPSYDGRRKEPDTLPVKFPLLLAQGVEGIAVGLACKIHTNKCFNSSIGRHFPSWQVIFSSNT